MSEPTLTPNQPLASLKQALAKATPGPWCISARNYSFILSGADPWGDGDVLATVESDENLLTIIRLRNKAEALVEVVEAAALVAEAKPAGWKGQVFAVRPDSMRALRAALARFGA